MPLTLIRRLACSLALLAGLCTTPALADSCTGRNLFTTLAPPDTARLDAATAAQPYATGNFWRATRDGRQLHLIGTFHLADSRHAATLARLAPVLRDARTLLVEAGPEEERALKAAMARNPDLVLLPEGPTLRDRLGPADWATLTKALQRHQIPAIMAARMRPWFVAVTLSMSGCTPAAAMENGLDKQLIQRATAARLPIRALEPYTTVFTLFDSLSEEDQLGMIRSALQMEDQLADYATTLSDAYFAEDSRRLWEFTRIESAKAPGYTPARADAEFARLEAALMTRRNREWIAVLEQAAAEGPALAAFGALHLSGHDGVLALLAARGWALERLPL